MKLDSKPTKISIGLQGKHYTDSTFFEQELRSIWHHTWQFVGRDEDIPEPGDYFTCILGQEPIVVIRMPELSIRARHNDSRQLGARLQDGQVVSGFR